MFNIEFDLSYNNETKEEIESILTMAKYLKSRSRRVVVRMNKQLRQRTIDFFKRKCKVIIHGQNTIKTKGIYYTIYF